MVKNGPFDGLMGFSQGAIICAASPGMQSDGSAFTKVPKKKFVIIMAGVKFGGCILGTPKLVANAFSSPIKCPSLHTIGEKDSLLQAELELLDAFVEPSVIYHPEGHTIPRLDEKGLKTVLRFIEKIEKLESQEELEHLDSQCLNLCVCI